MKSTLRALLVGFVLTCGVSPVIAHHSFSVEYDVDKPIKLSGLVTKLEWTNPHARLYVDVANPDGSTTNWNLEMASPNILERNGWTRRAVKAGDKVTFEGFAGRNAANRGIANSVSMADGRALFAGAEK
jgi:hypothetical protein